MKIMKTTCRHRKRIAMVSAIEVDFLPDDEPYQPGVEAKTPFEELRIELIVLYYCERCKAIVGGHIDPAHIHEETRY